VVSPELKVGAKNWGTYEITLPLFEFWSAAVRFVIARGILKESSAVQSLAKCQECPFKWTTTPKRSVSDTAMAGASMIQAEQNVRGYQSASL
jgi:hypothetical protein